MARLAHNDYLQQASDSGWIAIFFTLHGLYGPDSLPSSARVEAKPHSDSGLDRTVCLVDTKHHRIWPLHSGAKPFSFARLALGTPRGIHPISIHGMKGVPSQGP